MFNIFCIVIAIPLVGGLPYNPSYIWVSPLQEHSIAYSLYPESSISNKLHFQSLNLSEPFDTVSPSFSDLPSPPLSKDVKAVVPATDTDGAPTIYTGNCQDEFAEIWRFEPESDSSGDGEWSQYTVQPAKSKGEFEFKGPNHLASALTFPSSDKGSLPDVFVFGGMCPTSEVSTDDWVSAANYSRSMLSLQAETTDGFDPIPLSIKSPPVAEAGFSMTPLVPAHSNSSTGNQLRQQSFVLIGGHTQNAFINMSQVALFSLPEESWSYVLPNQASETLSSHVEDGRPQGVEPRSGHTAVLAEDGSKIIVFGGWVGNISVPAEPQLVILELGEDYGGSGDWAWTAPKISPPQGLREGTGIFGHGAAILPGGVMMVAGGYQISHDLSKRSILEPHSSDHVYLFNTTSETWIDSYTVPDEIAPNSEESSGVLSSASQKVGLGVGLGLGVPFVSLAVIFFLFVRNRRSREHRRNREQTLRSLALGAERPHFGSPEPGDNIYPPMTQLNPEQRPFVSTAPGRLHSANASHGDTGDWLEEGPGVAERTGLLVETPSPTRGLRANARTKGYQLASSSDDPRRNLKFSSIHPINEGEEYYDGGVSQPEEAANQRDSKSSGFSDPFKDPPSPSKALFPSLMPQNLSSTRGDETNLQNWTSTVRDTSPDSLPNILPDKQDRTLSNLSGASNAPSMSSHRTNTISLNRTASQRSTFAPQLDDTNDRFSSRYLETDKAMFDNYPMASRAPPPRIPFSQLQAEGGSLLGSNNSPAWMTPHVDPSMKPSTESSMGKAVEWAGSVRRALSMLRKTEGTERPPDNTQLVNQWSSSSSPTKSFHSVKEEISQSNSESTINSSRLQRTAVTASASALQRKQGAKDWNAKRISGDSSTLFRNKVHDGSPSREFGSVSGDRESRNSNSPAFTGYSHDEYDYDGEDWDVEAAAEGRVVQVTFTVPKEKLRVVNSGAGDSIDGDDDDVDVDDDDDDQKNDDHDNDRKTSQETSGRYKGNGEGSSKDPLSRVSE